jgi:hypothetical protein
LLSTQLRIVVALIAARRVGRVGATVNELAQVTGVRTNMGKLERLRWIMPVARVEGSNETIWAPRPQAAPRLELAGWIVLLFTEEELPLIDVSLPSFLPERERVVRLDGPSVIDTTGHEVAPLALPERVAS